MIKMVDSNENPLLGSKATSQKSTEQEPNPYNQKKDYLDYDKMDKAKQSSFADANTLVVKKDRPKVVVDTMRPMEDTPTEPTEPEDQPYKKVDYKKRYDDLKKHYDGRVTSFKQREDDLKEEIKSLKKTNETISRKEAETRLSRLHPDFTEIRESDDFHGWAESQPEQIKGWIYGNNADATLASRAIDLFKQDTGKSKQKSEVSGDLVPASEMVKVTNTKDIGYGTKKIWTRSQIAAMSQSEFDKNENAIEEAQREGRVVNDMSRSYGGSGNPTY